MGQNKVDVMTVTVGRRTTSRQRRESVAERLSAMAAVLEAFDADLAARPPEQTGALDRGRLRGIVRALVALAVDDPAFDVTVTVAPTGAAVRVHHPAGVGPAVRFVTAPGAGQPVRPVSEAGAVPPPAGPPAPVARELAELLRRGELGR